MPYDNIEDIWKYLLIKAEITLVSDFWFEAPQKISYSTNLKDIESMRFCQNILSPFWASFFKNLHFFSLFPTYNLISGVSYGHDFFYWRKDTSFANFSDT